MKRSLMGPNDATRSTEIRCTRFRPRWCRSINYREWLPASKVVLSLFDTKQHLWPPTLSLCEISSYFLWHKSRPSFGFFFYLPLLYTVSSSIGKRISKSQLCGIANSFSTLGFLKKWDDWKKLEILVLKFGKGYFCCFNFAITNHNLVDFMPIVHFYFLFNYLRSGWITVGFVFGIIYS